MTRYMSAHRTLAATAAAAVLGLAGCASVAVTNDALQEQTAAALSASPGSFQITNRKNSGVKTTYDVQLADGRQYACYVTGTVSVTGRVVSDAICQPSNTQASTAPKPASTAGAAPAACNALLKAAGKC